VKILTTLSLALLLTLRSDATHAQATTPYPGGSPFPFDQKKIALHFQLLADGGAIDLMPIDSPANACREIARNISQNLAAGNFDLALFSEPVAPPNVSELRKHKADFTYRIEEIAYATRIRIATTTTAARTELHNFLRFEITARKTGDSMIISNRRQRPGDADLGRDAPPGPEVPRQPPN
jgi:hypothetical protein